MFPPPETLKSHPDYERVVSHLKATPMRDDGATPGEQANRMTGSVYAAAQLYYLAGEKRKECVGETGYLRRIRNEWPLPYENFDHSVTLDWGPMLAKSAWLWLEARVALDSPLRWMRWRQSEPRLVSQKRSAAMHATNHFVGLKLACMIEWVLNGKHAANVVAKYGFGNVTWYQSDLATLLVNCFDINKYPRFDRERLGHLAHTSRPACVWLCDNFVGQIPKQFYELPLTTLLKGPSGYVTPSSIPGHPFAMGPANDDYESQPVLGPLESWTSAKSPASVWARDIIKGREKPSIDWLVIDDSAAKRGWDPPTHARTIGPWKFTAANRVEFTPFTDLEVTKKAPRVTTAHVIEV